jgi:hypothetical protein
LRSSPAQFAALVAGYLRLLQAERTLLNAEFQAARTKLVRGLIFVIAAAVLFLIAFILIVAAAVSALIEIGWAASWANLCVALTVCITGCVFILIGRGALRRFTVIPHRTFSQLRKDFQFARDGLGWNRR